MAESYANSFQKGYFDKIFYKCQADLNAIALPSGTFKGQLHDLKNAINYSMAKMKESVQVSIEASNVVSSAATEVSDGAAGLSSRVQEQAAALEETSATMEQIHSQILSNTEHANQAMQLSSDMRQRSKQGIKTMQETIDAMHRIQESSERIGEIVTLIDSIAFQTNLLALNAAVEAARAGEQGKGFAVVAGEVRGLAQKSTEAAKDIKYLIDESKERVTLGASLAGESGELLEQINKFANEVGSKIVAVSKASKEQTTGVGQIHEAITEIDTVTQQNAALVEETSAAAETLSHQAQNLEEEMSFFKTGKSHTLDVHKINLKATSEDSSLHTLPPKNSVQKMSNASISHVSKIDHSMESWDEF